MIGNRSEHLDRIKERLSVSEALNHFGVKATAGRGKALCPCHSEKTASLSYDDDRGLWNCFGCGKGGDVLSLIMEKEGLDFREALRVASGWTGIPVPEHDPVKMEKERAVHSTLHRVAMQAHRLLKEPKGSAALEYLHGRGIDDSTIERFMLGYYPPEGLGSSISKPELEAAGLIGEKGELFKRYITFPHLHHGVVEYITGRRPDGGKPKSMKPLSGDGRPAMARPYLAGDAMAAEPSSIHVNEGELNALSMWQAERPAVATCGSKGLGERLKEWLTTARSRGKSVYLCFDSDEAGTEASTVYGGSCEGLRVVTMPKGKDANDILQEDPKEFTAALDRLVAESRPWLEVQAEKTRGDSIALTELLQSIALWDPATPTERTKTFSTIAELGGHKIGDIREEFAEILRRPESSPVKVLSRIKAPEGYFLEVEYKSPSGDTLTTIKPREIFLDSRNIGKLAGEGFPVSTVSAKERITQIESLETGADSDELGHLRAGSWLPDRRSFALDEVLGSTVSRYIGEPAHLAPLRPSGSIDDFKALLRVYLPKHPLIPFICALALASPMLALDLVRMYIFHLYGETRSGKTAVEKLAAALYGEPKMLIHSSGTYLSLGEYLGIYPHIFSAFDDIAKNFRGKEWRSDLNKFIFTATDGQGRLRVKKEGIGLRDALSWHCALMSTAEESLITEDNIGGIGTRVIQYHVREPILSPDEAAELHRRLDGGLWGHAARAFIPYYIEHRDPDTIRELEKLIELRISLSSLRRVAPYMAAVVYAMEWLREWAQADMMEPLDVIDRIIERASEDEQEPYWVRGLRSIYEFTETYKHHFEEVDSISETTPRSPCYGKRDGDIYHIHEKPLREYLEKAGYDLARLRKELAERGYLEKSGSVTARLSTTKSYLKCIVFRRRKDTSSPIELN